jgi:hypothetical protein
MSELDKMDVGHYLEMAGRLHRKVAEQYESDNGMLRAALARQQDEHERAIAALRAEFDAINGRQSATIERIEVENRNLKSELNKVRLNCATMYEKCRITNWFRSNAVAKSTTYIGTNIER